MAVTRADKTAAVATLEGMFKGADVAILLDYKGINVPQVTELRSQLRKAKSNYKVVKNSLAKRALKGTSYETLSSHFEGTTAVAYTNGDPVALAKTLTTFMKTVPALTDQGGGGARAVAEGGRGRQPRDPAGQARTVREVALPAPGADGQPGAAC